MRLLPADVTGDDILTACREWVEVVASGRLEDALDMLHVPDRYDQSQQWTPQSLRQYIANYGSWDARPDGRTWSVTSIATARMRDDRPNVQPRGDVVRFDADPRSGSAELDLPLNGVWSDLTAQFEFEPVGNGTGLSLYDLHVL